MLTHRLRIPRSGIFNIDLIGAGGTGSHLFSSLCDIALTLPHISDLRIHVRVFDGDTVSETNMGRQRFYPCDIGHNKADVLVHRANTFLGLDFEAIPEYLDLTSGSEKYTAHRTNNMYIGCVDSAKARRIINQKAIYQTRNSLYAYYLDCGNKATTGQIILGQPIENKRDDWYGRLPTVMELFPVLKDATAREDDQPSCSVAEAIAKQDLFVNRAVAGAAGELLWQLLRHHEIGYHARFINTKSGTSTKLKIDPDEWKRFGHTGKRKPPVKKDHSIKHAIHA